MAFYALIVLTLWGLGGGMVIMLAALQGVPVELEEAARSTARAAGGSSGTSPCR